MIHASTLPKVHGYVETVISGKHVYRNIKTGEITEHPIPEKTPEEYIDGLEKENTLLRAQVQAMSDRNDFIEDCIAEMAEIVYA